MPAYERSEVLAIVAHELRTPLTSIRGYLETLLDQALDLQTRRRFLETVQHETLRLERLLDGMLQASLLEGRVEADVRECSLHDQLERVCDIVAAAAEERGVRVDVSHCSATGVLLDGDACVQIFVNLISNAINYGRACGLVRVSARCLADCVVVCVDDDGDGVALCEREVIFASRVRGSNAALEPGTGLGLWIVRLLVARAGGKVHVVDSPLGGARFEVTLQRRAESQLLAS